MSASLFGLTTPVLTLSAGTHSSWERDASFDDVITIAQAADRLGFDHLTCSDHIGIPAVEEPRRGSRYYEPLATFGALAAVTTSIRLATYVLVLGYHHPLEIAKRYGTLDTISGGRVVLGVGVGSLEAEFDLIDAPFNDRGERGDDSIRALRAAYGQREPSYRGSHYDFDGLIIDPCAPRTDVPIWIGGRTSRSLRRAVELGDAWAPFGLSLDQMRTMLNEAKQRDSWHSRSTPLELVLKTESVLDPSGEPEQAADRIRATQAIGATLINANLRHHSATHYVEQLEALAGLTL